MLKINIKVNISLKQGDNSINAACSAEFELSEDITEKERQSLEQVSKLIAKAAANTINETLKSNTIQKLPAPQPMKRINNVSGSGVKPASENQISFTEFSPEPVKIQIPRLAESHLVQIAVQKLIFNRLPFF